MDLSREKFVLFLSSILKVFFCAGAAAAVIRHERVKRIIGGENVDIRQVPYMLSLRLDGEHICGAVIIGKEWSLTAAHCCIPGNLTLKSGSANLDKGGQWYRVSQATRHELYREGDDDYDLCALRVERAFEYSKATAPAKLPEPAAAALTHFTDGFICGWGYTGTEGIALSPRLQLTKVSRVDLKDCKHAYRYLYTIHDDDVCYGSGNGSKDACQGDSGGPLISSSDNQVLVGIVSFGDECGYSKLPGVYVDVAQFREWIKRTTQL